MSDKDPASLKVPLPRIALIGRHELCKEIEDVLAGFATVRGNERASDIHDTPCTRDHAESSHVWVLYGLGGVGKTQLAMEIAHCAESAGLNAWWVRADGLVPSLSRLSRKLGTSQEADPDHPDSLWERLNAQEKPWVLVVDGVRHPEDLAAPSDALEAGTGWVRPPWGPGIVLITTRNGSKKDWGSWARLRELQSLSPEEGGQMILGLAPGAGTVDEAQDLSRVLGGLPLALWHAGTYLAKVRRDPNPPDAAPADFTGYAQRLRSSSQPYPESAQGLYRSLAKTWDVSLDYLAAARNGVDARSMLKLLACLGPAPIPYPKLLDPARIGAFHELFQGRDRKSLGPAFHGLEDQALVRTERRHLDPDGSGVCLAELHPKVRAVIRSDIKADPLREEYLHLVLGLVTEAIAGLDPEPPGDWQIWELLAPHCDAPLQLVDHWSRPLFVHDAVPFTEPLLAAARYLLVAGQYQEADQALQRVYELRLTCLGDRHSDTLTVRHERACLLRHKGEFDAAVREFDEVLRRREEARGEGHPATLGTRHERALTFREMGNLPLARAELSAVLKGYGSASSTEEERQVLRVSFELVALQERGGDHPEVQDELQQIWQAQRTLLGADHPETLETKRYLDRISERLGNFDSPKVARIKKAVAVLVSVLSGEHPTAQGEVVDRILMKLGAKLAGIQRWKKFLIQCKRGEINPATRDIVELDILKAAGKDEKIEDTIFDLCGEIDERN